MGRREGGEGERKELKSDQKHRQTYSYTDGQTDRLTERERETDMNTQRQRETETQRQRERKRNRERQR